MDLKKSGYNLGVVATIIVLFWIGILKFTPTEALAIKGYVSNSFLMSWLYHFSSDQGVSNFIGIYELITGILLIASFWNAGIGLIAGYLTAIIFLTTLSFLITTPGIWKLSDGVPVTDFFVIKDLAFLAIALQVIGKNKNFKMDQQGDNQ
ncbi:hypothetical protein CPT03_18005 [Pedobacter ginsengisoli]|uniref:DUF417 domain-containing protein n=1 Tax=Pedobacter ginsengisoli TaxID=363852 RepID=A0A2D1U9G9_9SPHI|nr:DUF417 family protein [Pedobacter ginsengisoli]ATP58222.1 hypothetical protein CPT03_18005 [Pedobacter ginsengisoli]